MKKLHQCHVLSNFYCTFFDVIPYCHIVLLNIIPFLLIKYKYYINIHPFFALIFLYCSLYPHFSFEAFWVFIFKIILNNVFFLVFFFFVFFLNIVITFVNFYVFLQFFFCYVCNKISLFKFIVSDITFFIVYVLNFCVIFFSCLGF